MSPTNSSLLGFSRKDLVYNQKGKGKARVSSSVLSFFFRLTLLALSSFLSRGRQLRRRLSSLPTTPLDKLTHTISNPGQVLVR